MNVINIKVTLINSFQISIKNVSLPDSTLGVWHHFVTDIVIYLVSKLCQGSNIGSGHTATPILTRTLSSWPQVSSRLQVLGLLRLPLYGIKEYTFL